MDSPREAQQGPSRSHAAGTARTSPCLYREPRSWSTRSHTAAALSALAVIVTVVVAVIVSVMFVLPGSLGTYKISAHRLHIPVSAPSTLVAHTAMQQTSTTQIPIIITLPTDPPVLTQTLAPHPESFVATAALAPTFPPAPALAPTAALVPIATTAASPQPVLATAPPAPQPTQVTTTATLTPAASLPPAATAALLRRLQAVEPGQEVRSLVPSVPLENPPGETLGNIRKPGKQKNRQQKTQSSKEVGKVWVGGMGFRAKNSCEGIRSLRNASADGEGLHVAVRNDEAACRELMAPMTMDYYVLSENYGCTLNDRSCQFHSELRSLSKSVITWLLWGYAIFIGHLVIYWSRGNGRSVFSKNAARCVGTAIGALSCAVFMMASITIKTIAKKGVKSLESHIDRFNEKQAFAAHSAFPSAVTRTQGVTEFLITGTAGSKLLLVWVCRVLLGIAVVLFIISGFTHWTIAMQNQEQKYEPTDSEEERAILGH